MKNKFIRKLVTSVTLIMILLLITVSGIAGQTQPVNPRCGGKLIMDEWVQSATTATERECLYTFTGSAGQLVTIRMERDNRSPRLDPYLDLYQGVKDPKYPYGAPLIADDDSAGNGNSLIEGYRLPANGAYTVIAHSYNNETYGAYWLYATLYR